MRVWMVVAILGFRLLTAIGVAEPIETKEPSPDGRFALAEPTAPEGKAIDLVRRKTGTTVLHLQADDDETSILHPVLWARDSRRFALWVRATHIGSFAAAYQRSGRTFRKLDLPEMPKASIPKKYFRGDEGTHWYSVNAYRLVRWLRSGNLIIEAETSIHNDGREMNATRKLTVAFSPKGRGRIINQSLDNSVKKTN